MHVEAGHARRQGVPFVAACFEIQPNLCSRGMLAVSVRFATSTNGSSELGQEGIKPFALLLGDSMGAAIRLPGRCDRGSVLAVSAQAVLDHAATAVMSNESGTAVGNDISIEGEAAACLQRYGDNLPG